MFKGYFVAPVDGDYIFRGVADDQFSIYLSSDYGTVGTLNSSNLIAYSNSAQSMTDMYIVDHPSA